MEDFKAKDIYLAASLVSSGFEVKRLEKIKQKNYTEYYFVFNVQSRLDPNIRIDGFVSKYWAGNLFVDAKHLFSNFRELKNRLYNQ